METGVGREPSDRHYGLEVAGASDDVQTKLLGVWLGTAPSFRARSEDLPDKTSPANAGTESPYNYQAKYERLAPNCEEEASTIEAVPRGRRSRA